jgi:hypothetical protein
MSPTPTTTASSCTTQIARADPTMLFDLRGAGRRTTIKAVYLSLAVLMGGGLVLFGIGGDVSGGLVDAITDPSTQNGNLEARYERRVREARAATQADPQNAAAWATLARARYQLASAGDNFDQATAQFTPEGQNQLTAAGQAWEEHLEVADTPDASVASVMIQAYSQFGLNDPERAVRAAEIIADQRDTAANFARLAILSYQAGQTRKGDLARREAIQRSDKEDREGLRAELDSAKQQALQAQLQESLPEGTTPEDAAGAIEEATGGSGGGSGGGGGSAGGGGSGGGGGGG